jgi:metacaspase-1
MTRNLSINIGLNRVDPSKYDGWEGLLGGCVNDANAMRTLAKDQRFSTLRLINEQATRAAVIRAIGEAGKTLDSDETLLLTYSGHGGQVPDANGDEDDGRDETWVLFDGMLIDDELYQLWSSFKRGVRIIMISDSCHSGTVLRVREFREALTAQVSVGARAKGIVDTETAFGVRLIPPAIAEAAYHAHPEIYEAAQFTAFRGDRAEAEASVILISGCQDNQLSADTGQNGLFTLRMLDVWNDGNFDGGYRDFVKEIGSRMPAEQQPNFATTGRQNPEFEAERPFTVVGEKNPHAGSNGNNRYENGWRKEKYDNGNSVYPGLENPDLARYNDVERRDIFNRSKKAFPCGPDDNRRPRKS